MSVLDEMAIGSQKYHKSLQQYLEPAKHRFGIDSIGYVSIKHTGELINVHSNLAWLEHCLDMKYYVDDPHMLSPDNIDAGMVLWSTYEDEEYSSGMLRDAIESYDLCHGITLIEKDEFGYRVYGFATTIDNHLLHSKILNDMDSFKKYVKDLKQKLTLIEQKLSDHQIDFPTLKGKTYYDQVGILKHPNDDKTMQQQFLKAIGIN